MENYVSPLRAYVPPKPHHPDQATMFEMPVDVTYGPLVMTVSVSLRRETRQKCSGCGLRRVCYFIDVANAITSPRLCARCAGIR